MEIGWVFYLFYFYLFSLYFHFYFVFGTAAEGKDSREIPPKYETDHSSVNGARTWGEKARTSVKGVHTCKRGGVSRIRAPANP